MTDKKEIAELSVKVSVDTTDLDKLEAQLKRIAGLMVDVGLKNKAEFKIDVASGNAEFTGITTAITQAKVFVNDVFIDKAVVHDAVCKAASREPSKIMCRVGDMTYMRDGSVLLGSEGYIGKVDSDAAMAFKLESLNQGLKRLADNTQKNQKQMKELTQAFNDANAAIADKIRQISIDAIRNNSGFA
ncbi:hypothetical protein GKR54_06910 [Providencia alcalifaciens]|uniref:hypothetical protein n=1 Tax=Providencia alcalifaciens TaxID=126385 RepID=UPI0012B53AF6|nr:hypothetical protein [Providencia alcalifaciens]MTC30806.1 hypothetical protein [Providencia alcalifaciens]